MGKDFVILTLMLAR